MPPSAARCPTHRRVDVGLGTAAGLALLGVVTAAIGALVFALVLIWRRRHVATCAVAEIPLFAIGAATESGVHADAITSVESGRHDEANVGGEHDEGTAASGTGERILGTSLESTPVVVLAVVISVALAAVT